MKRTTNEAMPRRGKRQGIEGNRRSGGDAASELYSRRARDARDEDRAAARPVQRTAHRIAELHRLRDLMRGNVRERQHQRLRRAFRGGPLTVIDAREHLDVLAFSARVAELEAAGHRFSRAWVIQTTGAGHAHRVVQIALVKEAAATK